MTKIRKIAVEQLADHVLIQIPPKSDLDVLAKTFTVADESGAVLSNLARIEGVVTVVDGRSMLATLETAAARQLIERIQRAQLIVIEGIDRLSPELQQQTLDTINALNPEVRVERLAADLLGVSALRMAQDPASDAGANPDKKTHPFLWPEALV